ncbi:MAG: polysaccharide pyruvyl transferase family protein [bacterium]
MKICILTQALRNNYGGLLQAYALQKILLDMGHDVVTDKFGAKIEITLFGRVLHYVYSFIKRYVFNKVNYDPFKYLLTRYDKEAKERRIISQNTDRFIEKHIKTIDFFNGRTRPHTATLNQFDAIVVGSDQTWRYIYNEYTPAYFLNFINNQNIKRIAYAASFGKDDVDEYPLECLNICRANLELFDGISVREDSGVKLCKEFLNADATHVLDPTLLIEKEDYIDLIECESINNRDNILMCYILDQSSSKTDSVKFIRKRLGLQVLKVMPQENYAFGYTQDVSKCVFPCVSEWIAGFRDAKFVVTDSFHGTVFSIIFNVPFITITNNNRGNTRIVSLLRLFNLEHLMIESVEDINDSHFNHIDFIKVNSIKKQLQQKSLDFLKILN